MTEFNQLQANIYSMVYLITGENMLVFGDLSFHFLGNFVRMNDVETQSATP